jgi:hypothetical protein
MTPRQTEVGEAAALGNHEEWQLGIEKELTRLKRFCPSDRF